MPPMPSFSRSRGSPSILNELQQSLQLFFYRIRVRALRCKLGLERVDALLRFAEVRLQHLHLVAGKARIVNADHAALAV